MGPQRHRPREGARRQAAHARRRPAGRLLRAALPQPDRQAARLHPRLRLRRREAASASCPGRRRDAPGFGKAYKKHVRDYAGAFISMGGFGEVLPRYENSVEPRSRASRTGGASRCCKFDYQFGDNERKMAADMADTAQEMFEAAGIEIVERRQRTCSPRAGRSTSWAPRAWAAIRRRRC